MTHQQLEALCELIDAKIAYLSDTDDSRVYNAKEVVRVLFEDD